MSKYIKLFETTNQYDAYTADTTNFILPNLSLCKDAPTVVYYNPPTPSHEYVEIGGVKWATMNVGATDITDYGLYFQWGDTSGYTADQIGVEEGKKFFDWEDYKYAIVETGTSSDTASSGSGGTTVVMTKYNDSDGKTVLDASDDAVQANWGGSWRMPTTAEFAALGDAIDYIDVRGDIISTIDKHTTLNGVTGLYVADKTDHSKRLFFPAAGYADNGDVNWNGSDVTYWSSYLNSDSKYGHCTSSSQFGVIWGNSFRHRYLGLPVRGVLDES